MSAMERVLAAIEAVSGTLPCGDCGGTVTLTHDEILDCVVIRHPVRHPFGPAARDLAAWVQDELAALITMADYGEPVPLNVCAVT